MILVANHLQLLNGSNRHSSINYNKGSSPELENRYSLDEHYMWYALQLAKQSLAQDEVPVGSIVVCNDTGNIVSYAHNRTICKRQICMHAELNAIKLACKYFNNHRLPNCRIYSTLEPCAMCAGAIIHARFSEVIFGAFDKKTGVCGSVLNIFDTKINHHTKVKSGILYKDCSQILKNFFKEKRKFKKI